MAQRATGEPTLAPKRVFTTRPVIQGRRGVITSGHYLATAAGFRIMEQGGNAIDAAAAVCFCLNLLEPHMNGTGGEAPTLIYSARDGKPFEISGMGCAPSALTIEWCGRTGIDIIPGDGFIPACVPATVDTWATSLARFGTMSFAQILQPAIELAEEGYPMYDGLAAFLASSVDKFTKLYPTTGDLYLPGGRPPGVGDLFRNPDYAAVLKRMVAAEEGARAKGRIAGIEAARDDFYTGETAARMVEYARSHPVMDATGTAHAGLLSMQDMAGWRAGVGDPPSFNYRGIDVWKCGPWTQGPVFLQELSLLQGYDLPAMGHNSAEYLHTVIESAKLAFADREAYYGDPLFDDVPLDALLSPEYAERRRARIGETASGDLCPGDIGRGTPQYCSMDVLADNRRALGRIAGPGSGVEHNGDTTHLDVIDCQGNMVASTPSGGWLMSSPVIPGLGFPLGTRAQMFYLDPGRPNALAPGKRPRATLTPSLATRNGEPFMAFGTPGGDSQDQTTLQFFLNYVEFGMNIQEALDAPTAVSVHFPSSFYPRTAFPRRVMIENRVAPEVISELGRRGHEVVLTDAWSHGKVMGIRFDKARGVIQGGVSAKGIVGYAIGW